MTHEYDVVIAGAGPAGSAAAAVLAGRGLSVALLDRRDFPRNKLCGGLLTWKTRQILERVFGPGVLDGVADHASDRYEIFHWDRLLAAGRSPEPFVLVKRRVLDLRLLELARARGAAFFPGRTVAECRPERGELATAGGEVFRGRYVIGADGAGSVVRKCLGADREAWRKGLAGALEVFLPREAVPGAVDHPRLYAGCVDKGYGWVFPNSDGVVVGLCGLLRSGSDFPQLLRKFLDFLQISDAVRPRPHGHPLPYGNHLKTPYGGRALLAGDAGGFVEPLLGEGIFYALTTGRYAAEAVLEALDHGGEPGPAYARRIRRVLVPEFRAADTLRWTLFALLRGVGPGLMGGAVRLFSGPLVQAVHGLRSYRFLLPKTWD
ncbi:geranylgeranyl reductase family protein [Desulfovibrio aminophilus]|uniref:NAD(P)/FAD-dependent oxidoreductase n=1 Tax=Desulfovibrio aminophilus TaxID=81425 RepID=UPI00339A9709